MLKGICTCAVVFSAVPHSSHAHTKKEQQISSTVAMLHTTSEHRSTLTKHCSPVEEYVLVHMMFHGKHTDTEKQQYMFHSVG